MEKVMQLDGEVSTETLQAWIDELEQIKKNEKKDLKPEKKAKSKGR